MENTDQLTIKEIVCQAIINNPAVKVDQVDTSMSLADLKVDSLEKISLAMDFEETFAIDITDEEVEEFLTIGDIIAYIEQAIANTQNTAEGASPQEASYVTPERATEDSIEQPAIES